MTTGIALAESSDGLKVETAGHLAKRGNSRESLSGESRGTAAFRRDELVRGQIDEMAQHGDDEFGPGGPRDRYPHRVLGQRRDQIWLLARNRDRADPVARGGL